MRLLCNGVYDRRRSGARLSLRWTALIEGRYKE